MADRRLWWGVAGLSLAVVLGLFGSVVIDSYAVTFFDAAVFRFLCRSEPGIDTALPGVA